MQIVTAIGAKEVIPLFNKVSDAVQSKIPMLLAMTEMTPEEVAVLERLLTREERVMRGTLEGRRERGTEDIA